MTQPGGHRFVVEPISRRRFRRFDGDPRSRSIHAGFCARPDRRGPDRGRGTKLDGGSHVISCEDDALPGVVALVVGPRSQSAAGMPADRP